MNRIPRDRTMKSVAIVVASTFITTGVLAQTGTEQEDPNRPTRPGQQDRPMAGQQDRTQAHRTGQRNPELAQYLQRIQMLEGEWDVKVEVLAGSGSSAAHAVTAQGTATREWALNKNLLKEKLEITDVTAGTGGEMPPGTERGDQSTQQKQQQIEALITRTLTSETDMERTESQQAAERIARDVVQKLERGQTGDLGQTLATQLQQAGVEAAKAREVAQDLERQITQMHGGQAGGDTSRDTVGDQSTQQKQQQIEALITRTLTSETDMERTEAQQAAERIARDVVQKLERGQTGDLGQTLATQLEQAGVDRTEARQVASELEQQIRRMEGRDPGQPDQRRAAGSPSKDLTAKLRDYQGLGLFGYDLQSDRYSHLWADSATGGMIFSLGNMDDRTKTIIFSRHYGGEADARGRLESEIERARETARDLGDDDIDIDADDDPDLNPIYGRDTPTLDRPDTLRGAGDPTVVLEIVSDQKHIIRMLEQKEDGTSVQYQITYTKKGTSQPTPGATNRGGTTPNPGGGN